MSTKAKLKASSLRFYLYSRPLHPELFEIHHGDHVVQNDYQARVIQMQYASPCGWSPDVEDEAVNGTIELVKKTLS